MHITSSALNVYIGNTAIFTSLIEQQHIKQKDLCFTKTRKENENILTMQLVDENNSINLDYI